MVVVSFASGSEAYLVENGVKVNKVVVVRAIGEFCVVKFPNGGAIKVRQSRLFATPEEAIKKLEKLHPEFTLERSNNLGMRNGQLL